jgi:type VI secretion system protein ImpM
VPARGDFLSRRLDSEFIGGWDAWLQQVLSQSREALGARWLECFLSAPVWRFVVPPGMFSKAGWVGLLLPSVDRVGRYFPLTIAAPVHEESIDVPATLSRAMAWLDSIDALALDALRPTLDFDAFDRRLAGLPMPADVPVVLPIDDTVPAAASQPGFQVWQFAPDVADTTVQQALEDGPLGMRGSSALWMTRGGETFTPCLAVCGDLIPGGQFCALLDGRWSDHAWTLVPKPASPSPAGTQGAVPGSTNVAARDPAIYCDPKTPGVDLVHGQGKRGEEVPPLAASPSSENEKQMNTRLEK